MSNTHVKNIKLGACAVSFGGQDLGYTKGGVEVEVSTETLKVTVDQLGQTTISELVQGRNVKVTAPLAESVLANLVNLMPGSTMSADNTTLSISSAMGVNLVDVAQELVLTPQDGTDFVLTLPKAATAGNFTMAYKSDDVRVFSVDFNAYPDDDGVLGTMTNPKSNAGSNTEDGEAAGGESTETVEDVVATAVAFDPYEVTLQVGDTYQLNPVFTPEDTTDKTGVYSLVFESGSVTVSETGLVTAISASGDEAVRFVPNGDTSLYADIGIYVA